jgi:hypothetical protein
MNSILDNSLVGLALAASAAYALSSLGPRSLRQRLLAVLSRLMARAPALLGLRQWAQRLQTASADKAAGSCGGCDNCGSEQSPSPSPKLPTAVPGAEIRVSVAKIGRRS